MSTSNTAPRPPVSTWSALRRAFSSLVEDLPRFLAASVLWSLAAAVVAVAGALFPPAYVLGVALVPLTAGLGRMAGCAARDTNVDLRRYREGVRRNAARHVGLGLAQAVLLGMAALNVVTGLQVGGLVGLGIVAVSANVALVTWLVVCAAWPLLLDPERNGLGWRPALRLSLAVVAARPLTMIVVAVIVAGLAVAVVQVNVLALLFPVFAILVATHHVLPVADWLEGRAGGRLPG